MLIVTVDVFLSDAEVEAFKTRLDWPEDATKQAAGAMVRKALDAQRREDHVIVSVEHRTV